MFKITEFKASHLVKECYSDERNPSFSFSCFSDETNSSLKSAVLKMNGWKIETLSQNNIFYAGEPLTPFTKYVATLEVEDSLGRKDKQELIYETGYLGTSFKGKWISDKDYIFREKGVSPKPLLFKKELSISKKIKCVKVYATALGIYDFILNGKKVGNAYFAPGFTSYRHELQYQVYDVTNLLEKENTLFFEVAGGWAVGSFVMTRKNRDVADRQALLCDIHLEYEDGSKEIIGTDESWQVSEHSPVLMADIYDGETYDARIEANDVSFHQASYEKVRIHPEFLLDYGAKVIAHERMLPQKITKLSNQKKWIVDFGQNFAGVVSFHLKNAKRGQSVVIKHAEILKKDGDLNTSFLRSAKATLTYICKGGEESFSPTLTYMGFRYISIEGIENIEDIDIEAIALYSDIEQIGDFECSNPLINRLQKNILWSSKSNFVDIPTDCPQRDERMGWTGDIAIFSKTACFNFDMNRFLDKWLLDLRKEQLRSGGLPNTIPSHRYAFPVTMPKMAVEFWGDASLLVPMALYEKTGDKTILSKSYESMKKYVNACKFWAHFGVGKHRYIWHTPSIFHFGDWVAPDVAKMSDWQKRSKWTATASLKNTSTILSNVAHILGKREDEIYYKELSQNVSEAYESIFTDHKGKLLNEFQTGYVLSLQFHMLKEENVSFAAMNLKKLVEKNNYCIGTGFPGTPYILFALADNGYVDTAYKMLENTKCPSWLYEVKVGATTIWERWDGLDENGECPIGEDGTGGMISYNHYASGAVGDFLYRRVAGIEPLEAGYRSFLVKPLIGGSLTYAKAHTKTPYGTIEVSWEIKDKQFKLNVSVPYGSEAKIVLPNKEVYIRSHGNYTFEAAL